MKSFGYLIENFFTHKDKLAPASELPGTMFTPLHFAVSGVLLAIVVVCALLIRKRDKLIKPVFIVLWAVVTVLEVVKITWESTTGNTVRLEVTGILPLYACSIFMYAMPFAIWGKGNVKRAACGYVCTLGMLGASVNFFYPMTVLYRYSIISFSAMHSMVYHAVMLFTCLTMLLSGYHRYTHAERALDLLLPCIPSLIMSVPANIVNYTLNADYMFFRGTSAFLPAIFGDMNKIAVTVIIYALYIIVPACFYLPSFISHKVKEAKNAA
ncbi:MAG: YwaF family protein [Clostridia bacterium]|nr:YwaF family protein [Clostridia bacterium]